MDNTKTKASLLLIYTGGTIGMKQDPTDLTLKPFNFGQILEEVPELAKFAYRIDSCSFDPIIDSSDIEPSSWQALARLIYGRYDDYDGFIVLHGTDTMSYSASALSFMLEGLTKPVIFTGSQLPIGVPRTDGKENLISAVEIAAEKDGEDALQDGETAGMQDGENAERTTQPGDTNAESDTPSAGSAAQTDRKDGSESNAEIPASGKKRKFKIFGKK